MKQHSDGGFVDAAGDRYVWVGRELRKMDESMEDGFDLREKR